MADQIDQLLSSFLTESGKGGLVGFVRENSAFGKHARDLVGDCLLVGELTWPGAGQYRVDRGIAHAMVPCHRSVSIDLICGAEARADDQYAI